MKEDCLVCSQKVHTFEVSEAQSFGDFVSMLIEEMKLKDPTI